MRILKNRLQDNYGYIGEETGFKDICVGDVVAFICEGDLRTGLVCKADDRGYAVMGSMGRLLGKSDNGISRVKVVLKHRFLTQEILSSLENGNHLTIVEPKKMTMKEIERALGCQIEIVEEVK